MHFFYVIFVALLICPGCSFFQQKNINKENNQDPREVINLETSVQIIKKLICKKELYKILEEHSNPESINLLINNFSPAEMAFEAEALNQELPALVIYFTPDDNQWPSLSILFENLAQDYKPFGKFISINSEKLFKLAEKAGIENTPTAIIIQERKEIKRLERLTVSSFSELTNYVKEQLKSSQ